jgi:hypothetical protein
VTARRDRRFCTPHCRARTHAARKRKVVRREREQMLAELSVRLEEGLDERLLVARVLQAANTTGGWRAAAFLLRHVHHWQPVSVNPSDKLRAPDPSPTWREVDELALRRRLHVHS